MKKLTELSNQEIREINGGCFQQIFSTISSIISGIISMLTGGNQGKPA